MNATTAAADATIDTDDYRLDEYAELVAKATDRILRTAEEKVENGWGVDAAVQEAVDYGLSDFHASYYHDLFVAFHEYKDVTAKFEAQDEEDPWPDVDRDGLLSKIKEWTKNGPNPAESAALATAESMIIADAMAEARDQLTDADVYEQVNVHRFTDRLADADAALSRDGYTAILKDGFIRVYRFEGTTPQMVVGGHEPECDHIEALEEAINARLDMDATE